MVRETAVTPDEMSKASVRSTEMHDTRDMDFPELAERYGIRVSEVKTKVAEGEWAHLITEVYLPRLLEGESYDTLRDELKKNMADLDGFHPGSGPYARTMDIFQQVMRAGSSDKKGDFLSGRTRKEYMEQMKTKRERENS